jgi:hypothetical protein
MINDVELMSEAFDPDPTMAVFSWVMNVGVSGCLLGNVYLRT